MWTRFQEHEKLASGYTVTCYNQQTGVYKVQSTYQRSGDGGTKYAVKYLAKKCTCGRWQHQIMPCSHGIAVCRMRNKDPKTLISIYYNTTTWREQYNYHLHPLRDATYWTIANWTMKADPTRLITHRCRRQSRRHHNEMDERHNRDTGPPRCDFCSQPGHNRNSCSTRFG
ncbi:uncharacterized protein [Rutidosis leptorrhynchoides]|uniref:uncharacterized protein n=1 Tax=Rutidosis leptorrhynchoides TaxID=125765 RepID=UPI003A9A4179